MASDFDVFDNHYTAPPTLIVNRKARVQLGTVNTLRFPGDLFERRDTTWFEPGVDTQGGPREVDQPHPVSEKNHARFIVDGKNALPAMQKAIERASAPGDFVYMLNWWADPSLQVGNGPRFGEVLAAAANRGVQIRGMFWKISVEPTVNVLTILGSSVRFLLPPWNLPHGLEEQNKAMVDFINGGRATVNETLFDPSGKKVVVEHRVNGKLQPVGAAIHDDRLNKIALGPIDISVGSQHQKILCVRAGGELVAFCGGIDWNRDRIDMERTVFHGAPLHDVHCEVHGPAAGELLETFLSRWRDHPESTALDLTRGQLVVGAGSAPKHPDPTGRHVVQIGRTFGGNELLGARTAQEAFYAFAPGGEQTAAKLIAHAIRNARKFIYLEDQYFVNMDASQILAESLDRNNLAHITIVLPHHEIGDMPHLVEHRRNAIKNLKQKHPDRVRVFYRCGPGEKPGAYHTYVHSKITIIDDELAIIGSVNYARRSWSHDSEVCAGIYDPSSDKILTNRFAHWMRMRIWAEHLFGVVEDPTPPDQPPKLLDKDYAELFDGVAAGALWMRLIRLKEEFFANPNNVHDATFGQKFSGSFHPRDFNYDQSEQRSEPLTRTAAVRPYDEDDDPQEISPDVPFYDTFVDPPGKGLQVLPVNGPVSLRLGLTPAEAAKEKGSMRLFNVNASRKFDAKRGIADTFVANENTVDMVFEDVPTDGLYTLQYIAGDGSVSSIFENVEYGHMFDDSLPSP